MDGSELFRFIKDVVIHDGLHGGVYFRLGDVLLRFLHVEDDFVSNGVFKDQIQIGIRIFHSFFLL